MKAKQKCHNQIVIWISTMHKVTEANDISVSDLFEEPVVIIWENWWKSWRKTFSHIVKDSHIKNNPFL